MRGNPIMGLAELGQSVWIDTLSRKMITSGQLAQLVEKGVKGVTSNPTIFQKAMSGSNDYDEPMRSFTRDNITDPKEIFFKLAFEDVGAAADILRRTYEHSGGEHGLVSIEVSPDLAYNTEATIAEARWIFSSLGRKNIMVKVPATKEGLPAIEQLIEDGVNVNITLLFSVKRYEEVADAFMKGLERRVRQNHSIEDITSVASFFVSRVDTLTDSLLDEKIKNAKSEADKNKFKNLRGRTAVANAKLAYQKGEEIRTSERFKKLEEHGANFQRLLWGSTSTKNPEYRDIKYVQELIAPMSVNTMPLDTFDAFMDHGRANVTIRDDLDTVPGFFNELLSVGIDIEDVARELEKQGVKSFADSYFALLDEISRKTEKIKV